MVTAELARAPDPSVHGRPVGIPARVPARAPAALFGALVLLVLDAAFAGGASQDPAEARLQVGLAIVAALAAAVALLRGTLVLRAPRAALAGVALLAAFAAWCGLSVLWSVAPERSWLECNRVFAYAVVAVLATVCGASLPDPLRRLGDALLAVVALVAVDALGQKVLPGLHVAGLVDLNQTAISPRLRSPLDYWNALALFIGLGVPLAAVVAVDRAGSARRRLAALLLLPVLLITLGMTYSRGGLVALVLALFVTAGLGGARWRIAAAVGLAAAAALPALVVGLSLHSLTGVGVPLAARESAGLLLGAVLAGSLVALGIAGRRFLALERRWSPRPRTVAAAARWLRRLALAAGAVAVLAVALSPRGLGGTVSHVWHGFTSTHGTSVYRPDRLLSTDSGNRWEWWREAAGAFSDRPVAGWGAGSFGVLDLLYRRDGAITVLQPHEVPLQFLAETGIVGGLLGVGGFTLLLVGALRAVRRSAAGADRCLAAALFAAGIAYSVHALYDWDWDIPGVTVPVLVVLGMLAGAAGRSADPPGDPVAPLPAAPATALRGCVAVGVALAMCAFAASAALPSVARTRTSAALVASAGSSHAALRDALADAQLASDLDPLSDRGLEAAATIALHGGDPAAARRYLLAAVRREPDDVSAWQQLAVLEEQTGDVRGLAVAARRVLALDPAGPAAQAIAAAAAAAAASPAASPSAVGTPLPGP